MYYIYLLVNSDGDKYIGYTSDLRQRLKEHQAGESRYTASKRRDWKLIYYEAYPLERLARKREQVLKKNGSMRKHLYKRLELP